MSVFEGGAKAVASVTDPDNRSYTSDASVNLIVQDEDVKPKTVVSLPSADVTGGHNEPKVVCQSVFSSQARFIDSYVPKHGCLP